MVLLEVEVGGRNRMGEEGLDWDWEGENLRTVDSHQAYPRAVYLMGEVGVELARGFAGYLPQWEILQAGSRAGRNGGKRLLLKRI